MDADLAALAEAYGVATGYLDAEGGQVQVDPQTVRAVLGMLGVDPADPAAALADLREAPWRRRLPASVVVSAATPSPVVLHLPARAAARVELELEAGRRIALDPPGEPLERRELDGEPWTARTLALPAGLPLGDHLLHVDVQDAGGQAQAQTLRCAVVAVPDAVPDPPAMVRAVGSGPPAPVRTWGWMIQLYAVRSAASWGMGDYADLAELAAWSGAAGADVLLVNPLHAAAPTLPVAASPYSPVSRRFAAPLYLRPQETPEYARADRRTRAAVDELAAEARRAGRPGGLLDRDTVWRAKLAALELLFEVARDEPAPTPDAASVPDAASAGGATSAGSATSAGGGSSDGLADFATWCALAERHGADWRDWPADLARPDGPAVAAVRVELADRIAFHEWLQRRCDDQLAAAQAAARAAGMAVGIVHDLAVGVDPGGADAWALQDILAVDATVGAPPDTFNQQGQDWGLPPWRPSALAEAGYAPLRRMVAAVLRRGGGLRVDHILGLFRLWWIPRGAGAARGTYVRYDAAAMLGVIALEAARAGALVVGEDLGTVEPSVATTLTGAGVLGSTVLWFERDADGAALPPARYRPATMASLTTHDLPTAAGYLEGEHVRVRAGLGLLSRSARAEWAGWRAERDDLIDLLRAEGLLGADVVGEADVVGGGVIGGAGDEEEQFAPAVRAELALALHRLLVRSPCRVVLAAPGDALGDLHQPNLPGTVDEYPNWRLPVRDGDGHEVTIERLRVDPAVARLAALLDEVRSGAAGGRPTSTPTEDPSIPLTEDPGPTYR
ncbi:4-alpha-glucanotransferase [Frankia sp. AgB32]|uniref:4-alpha-glucanotransferase n=1 Tax=Frankia sp. AgB32 TaxID=631119 RepID=UPI00200FE251|nr:4-alpha-glucanotransferase [Frankia sp. AgB32]MCK9896823.1 4-alpha-glucanotransferase [Frankia sp. AgB32]